MYIFKFILIAVFGCLGFVTISNAAVLTTATVGSDDTWALTCPSLTPSDANEVACFGLAGISTTVPEINKLGNSFVELADAAGTYALELPVGYHSSHFLIKTGNIGGADKQYSFIFQNNAETGYAVFNLTAFQLMLADDQNAAYIAGVDFENIGKISHVTVFNTSAVPLPGAVWMMITGLGGIFGFRKFSLRRRKIATV